MGKGRRAIKIFIDYDFISWNKYINAERGNKYHANAIKQKEKAIVAFQCHEKYAGKYPVELIIKPHFKDRRRDLDNYRIKGILDGLVSAGVIKNDNLNCIDKITLIAVVDGLNGVEIEIKGKEV